MGRLMRRVKKSTIQYIMVCILSLLITAAGSAVIAYKIVDGIRRESRIELEKCYTEMEQNKKTVYIANKDIAAGEIITEDSVTRETVYAAQPIETYIDSNDIGKVALVNVLQGTQVLKNMITDNQIENDLREVQFTTIMISDNVFENDVVDVRIVYPNSEDYVVLSKKVIKGNTSETTNCYLWLSEEEILRMQSAVIDAYLYTGAYLYTTKYIEPNIQEASIVNYEPSVEAINLIMDNPNILQTATNEISTLVRKALENRLANSMKKDVAVEPWDLESNFIYKQDLINDQEEPDPSEDPKLSDTEVIVPSEDEKTLSTLDHSYWPETGQIDGSIIYRGADLGSLQNGYDEKREYGTDYFMLTEG